MVSPATRYIGHSLFGLKVTRCVICSARSTDAPLNVLELTRELFEFVVFESDRSLVFNESFRSSFELLGRGDFTVGSLQEIRFGVDEPKPRDMGEVARIGRGDIEPMV